MSATEPLRLTGILGTIIRSDGVEVTFAIDADQATAHQPYAPTFDPRLEELVNQIEDRLHELNVFEPEPQTTTH